MFQWLKQRCPLVVLFCTVTCNVLLVTGNPGKWCRFSLISMVFSGMISPLSRDVFWTVHQQAPGLRKNWEALLVRSPWSGSMSIPWPLEKSLLWGLQNGDGYLSFECQSLTIIGTCFRYAFNFFHMMDLSNMDVTDMGRVSLKSETLHGFLTVQIIRVTVLNWETSKSPKRYPRKP